VKQNITSCLVGYERIGKMFPSHIHVFHVQGKFNMAY